jgi:hypothetical protein
MVVPTREQDAHVNPVASSAIERFDLGRRRGEVRGGDPDGSFGGDRLDLKGAGDAKAQRLTFDDPDESGSMRRGIQVSASSGAAQKAM